MERIKGEQEKGRENGWNEGKMDGMKEKRKE